MKYVPEAQQLAHLSRRKIDSRFFSAKESDAVDAKQQLHMGSDVQLNVETASLGVLLDSAELAWALLVIGPTAKTGYRILTRIWMDGFCGVSPSKPEPEIRSSRGLVT